MKSDIALGGFISSVKPEIHSIVFGVKGKSVLLGKTLIMSGDIKKIITYQSETLRLLEEILGKRKSTEKHSRNLSWQKGYSFSFLGNSISIYRGKNCVGIFTMFSDNLVVIEYFLEKQMKLLEDMVSRGTENKR